MRDGPSPRRRAGGEEGDPEVFVADEQSDVEVDTLHLTRLAGAVLEAEGVRGGCELSLYFVEEAVIADLNQRFMGGEGATDVLAFPIDDDLGDVGRSPDASSPGPDRAPIDPGDVPVLLGDVVVCPRVAAVNAPTNTGSYPGHDGGVADELALLVVHGILHVLGMDHAEPQETAVMQARERELLARHHKS
jgi:probable rRNA maturation factor